MKYDSYYSVKINYTDYKKYPVEWKTTTWLNLLCRDRRTGAIGRRMTVLQYGTIIASFMDNLIRIPIENQPPKARHIDKI